MNTLGSKMKQIRIARGYTQDDIAEMMDVKRTAVSNWEKDIRTPGADKLIQYAKIVGVTLDFFQDDPPERALFQALTQLERAFTSADIPAADKDKAFKEIMEVYFNFKEIKKSPSPTPVPRSERLLHLKEE